MRVWYVGTHMTRGMRVQKSVGGVTYYVFCVLILRKDREILQASGKPLQDSEAELHYAGRME